MSGQRVTITFEVPDEDADPDDDTGMTEEAHLTLTSEFPYSIISVEKS